MQKKPGNILTRSFRALYLKLFRIDDSPQKIALGLGIGVFCGVFPGVGPVAALAIAFALRVNRAAALLGGIITNTWLSIPVFLVAIKAGAVISGSGYEAIRDAWLGLIKRFSWAGLSELSFAKVILPVLAGYLAVSLCIGAIAYLISLVILMLKKKQPTS